MQWTQPQRELGRRTTALLVGAAMIFPTLIAGCGGQPAAQNPPPPPGMGGQTGTRPMGQPPRQGMTGKQKLMLVAGAAALYYIYKKRQNAQQQAGPNGRYFRSEANGRVYYRDLKTGKFQYVSPPSQPLRLDPSQLSPQEVSELQRYQGFNGSSSGQGFGGYGGPGARNYSDAVPAMPYNG